jgi:rsbT co-antagonist protein RsbR
MWRCWRPVAWKPYRLTRAILSERIIPRGVETHEVVGIVLLLRDVLARSLFKKYQTDFDLLNRVLDAYEPRQSHRQHSRCKFRPGTRTNYPPTTRAFRELSTPVLQVRERLLIVPIIGVIDSQRARQFDRTIVARHPETIAPRSW